MPSHPAPRATWLIRAKLRPPLGMPGWQPRPRLLDQLADWLHATTPTAPRVVCLAATPGAGKTTLLAQWHAALGADGWACGWLSLDRGDDAPALFINYLIEALGARRGPAAAAARLLQRDWLTPPAAVLAALVNGLNAATRPIALFLDDADLIADPAALDLLATLLRYGPATLVVVLAGRAEPVLALGAIAAQGRLLRLGTEQLRFDLPEALALLRRNGSAAQDADQLEALWRRTEGWATGMVLAALSMRDGRPAADLLRDLADTPELAAWLADSVLARLPPATVDFLRDAAPFARFCAPLCDAVGMRHDSRPLLDALARQHLFVKPLGEGWFRFHALFAEHLAGWLRDHAPGRDAELRLRAAHWFAAQNHWQEAVAQALAAGDDALAGAWVERFSLTMVETGEVAAVAGWIASLPLRLRQRSLRLRLLHAWAQAFALELGRARDTLADIEADLAAGRLVADADTPGECLAVAAIIDGLSDRSDAAITRADAALATAPAAGSWVERTALVARTFGLCSAARFDEALACGTGAVPGPAAPLYVDVYQQSMRGLSLITAGELVGARQVLRHALALAETGAGPLSAAAALPAGYLAEVLHEQGESAEVAALLRDRADAAFSVAALGSLARFCVGTARVAAARGDLPAALAVLDRGTRAAASRGWQRLRALCLAEQVRLLCAAGDLGAARAAVADAVRDLPAAPPGRPNSTLETWLAWQEAQATLLLWSGHPDEALPWFRRLSVQARGAGFLYRAARMQILLALALDASGARPEAVAQIAELLPLAARQGMDASFIDLGPAGASLRDEARRQRDHSAGGTPLRGAAGAGLSPRELEILARVADGLSNKEIARDTGVTPETIKWHLKNVFGKLAVGNRQEAVQRALLLGLVTATAPRPGISRPPVRGVSRPTGAA